MQTRKRSDFIVGIVALIAIVTLILGTLWLKGNAFNQHKNSYTALFRQIGGIEIGDPVLLNGVRIGNIQSIALVDTSVAVTFAVIDTLKLYSSSTFTIMEVGLLGSKKLEITYRRPGEIIPPTESKQKPHYINGIYQNGVTETMGTINTLATKMITLIDTIQVSANSISGVLSDSGSLLPFLDTIMVRLDTITRVTQNVITRNDGKINQIVDNLQRASQATQALLDSNSSTITSVIHRSDSITLQLQSLLVQMDDIVAKIDSGDGLAAKFINDTTFTLEIDSTLQKFNRLVDEMLGSGVKVRVRLGHRDRDKKDTTQN